MTEPFSAKDFKDMCKWGILWIGCGVIVCNIFISGGSSIILSPGLWFILLIFFVCPLFIIDIYARHHHKNISGIFLIPGSIVIFLATEYFIVGSHFPSDAVVPSIFISFGIAYLFVHEPLKQKRLSWFVVIPLYAFIFIGTAFLGVDIFG